MQGVKIDMKVIHFAARYGRDQEKVWKCICRIRKHEESHRWAQLVRTSSIGETDKYGFNILHHAIQNCSLHFMNCTLMWKLWGRKL